MYEYASAENIVKLLELCESKNLHIPGVLGPFKNIKLENMEL